MGEVVGFLSLWVDVGGDFVGSAPVADLVSCDCVADCGGDEGGEGGCGAVAGFEGVWWDVVGVWFAVFVVDGALDVGGLAGHKFGEVFGCWEVLGDLF